MVTQSPYYYILCPMPTLAIIDANELGLILRSHLTLSSHSINSQETRNHKTRNHRRENRRKPTRIHCKGLDRSIPYTEALCVRIWHKTGRHCRHPRCTTDTPSNPRMKLSHHTSHTKKPDSIGGRRPFRSRDSTRLMNPSRPDSSPRHWNRIHSSTCNK